MVVIVVFLQKDFPLFVVFESGLQAGLMLMNIQMEKVVVHIQSLFLKLVALV